MSDYREIETYAEVFDRANRFEQRATSAEAERDRLHGEVLALREALEIPSIYAVRAQEGGKRARERGDEESATKWLTRFSYVIQLSEECHRVSATIPRAAADAALLATPTPPATVGEAAAGEEGT